MAQADPEADHEDLLQRYPRPKWVILTAIHHV